MLLCLYWFLTVVGGGFVILSFVIGELADLGEGLFDGINDTLGSLFDGILGGDGGGIELGDAGDVGIDGAPGPFSIRTVTMFGAGFGAGGLVGYGMGLSEPLTLLPAFGFGAVAGLVTWVFLRFLYGAQASTSVQSQDYVGLMGRVTVSIPEGKLGQVMVEVALQKRRLPARSEDASPIASQTQVEVVAIDGGVLIVRPIS